MDTTSETYSPATASSRRSFIKQLASATLGVGAVPWLPSLALAESPSGDAPARCGCGRAFEDEMVAHCQSFAPKHCELIGSRRVSTVVQRAIERARGYGFSWRGPIRTFIEMTFLYGSAFDSDPQYPWASAALRGSGPQMDRAEELYRQCLRYRASVTSWAGGMALARWYFSSKHHSRRSTREVFVDGLRQRLEALFPEKAEYIGSEALTRLVHMGMIEATKHGMDSADAMALMVELCFALGHRCGGDPLYPMISAVLEDPNLTTADARARRLRAKMRAHARRLAIDW